MEVNYFSVCFWVNTTFDAKQKGIYVKIPKRILFNKENEKIMPLSSDDKRLAEDEYHSLGYLSKHWPNDDMNVRFVKPLGFLKEYNAIITERIYAKHFFKMFRQFDLQRRFNEKPDITHHVLSRLGTSLSKFHKETLKVCTFNFEVAFAKMESCCLVLKSYGVDNNYINTVLNKIKKISNYDLETFQTNTLKGFDVRQVFIDKEKNIFLLDPGKMKFDYIEMDLARFIVTCRILYWGSILSFFRSTPNSSYEKSFIKAYYGKRKSPSNILNVLIIKELLKHWKMAYRVTGIKSWPSPIKIFIKKTYIDPFYKSKINAELTKLGI